MPDMARPENLNYWRPQIMHPDIIRVNNIKLVSNQESKELEETC